MMLREFAGSSRVYEFFRFNLLFDMALLGFACVYIIKSDQDIFIVLFTTL